MPSGGDHVSARFPVPSAARGRPWSSAISTRSGRVGTLDRMPFRVDGTAALSGPASST